MGPNYYRILVTRSEGGNRKEYGTSNSSCVGLNLLVLKEDPGPLFGNNSVNVGVVLYNNIFGSTPREPSRDEILSPGLLWSDLGKLFDYPDNRVNRDWGLEEGGNTSKWNIMYWVSARGVPTPDVEKDGRSWRDRILTP